MPTFVSFFFNCPPTTLLNRKVCFSLCNIMLEKEPDLIIKDILCDYLEKITFGALNDCFQSVESSRGIICPTQSIKSSDKISHAATWKAFHHWCVPLQQWKPSRLLFAQTTAPSDITILRRIHNSTSYFITSIDPFQSRAIQPMESIERNGSESNHNDLLQNVPLAGRRTIFAATQRTRSNCCVQIESAAVHLQHCHGVGVLHGHQHRPFSRVAVERADHVSEDHEHKENRAKLCRIRWPVCCTCAAFWQCRRKLIEIHSEQNHSMDGQCFAGGAVCGDCDHGNKVGAPSVPSQSIDTQSNGISIQSWR